MRFTLLSVTGSMAQFSAASLFKIVRICTEMELTYLECMHRGMDAYVFCQQCHPPKQ